MPHVIIMITYRNDHTGAAVDPVPHLPLKAVDFHILLVLLNGPIHGYGMVKEIERRSDGRIRLEPGNLYRYVRRLVDEGLVEPAGHGEPAHAAGERRRDYRVTPFGRAVLLADAERMRSLADAVEAGAAESGG